MLSRNRMQNITFVVAEDFNFDYEENKTVGDFINLMFNFAMISTILKEETCAILPKFILGKYCKIGYSRKLIPVTTYITKMQCFQQKHQRWRHCVKRNFIQSPKTNVQKTHWKWCVFWKCPYREIKWKFRILCSDVGKGFIKLTSVVFQFYIKTRRCFCTQ